MGISKKSFTMLYLEIRASFNSLKYNELKHRVFRGSLIVKTSCKACVRLWSTGDGSFNCRSRRPQARYLRAEDFEGYRSAEQPTRSERSERRDTPKNSLIISQKQYKTSLISAKIPICQIQKNLFRG